VFLSTVVNGGDTKCPNVGGTGVRKKGKGHAEEKSSVEWNFVLRYPDIYKKVYVD
jgi:hypothetical protein